MSDTRKSGLGGAGTRAGWRLLVVVLAGALTLAGGVAWAVIPDSGTGLIHGCYNTTSGALRVVDPSKGQACAAGEASLNWNAHGLNWRGGWSSTVSYSTDDVVTSNGSTYVARAANTNSKPPSANWALLAGKPYANVFSQSNISSGTFPITLSSNLTTIGSTTALPAGNYTVTAQALVFMDNDAQDVQCLLFDNHGNEANNYAETSGPPNSGSTGVVQTLSITDAFAGEPNGTRIRMECAMANGADPNNSEIVGASIVSNQVGTMVFNGTTNPAQ